MSQLTPDQRAKVEEWASEGANLNQIQDRLKADFGISLTYMEARLLLMDTGVKLKDKPREPEKPATPVSPPQSSPEAAEWDEDNTEPPAGEGGPPAGAGTVTLTLDQIAIPGAMVSGRVTFSDGQRAAWYLDQNTRLGLADVPPTYQPPKADIPIFQQELERLLAQSGF